MSTAYDGFIYRWVNQHTNKKYIGSHYGQTDDGYVGSGKWFLRAYKKNPHHFTREIVEYVQGTYKDVLDREQHYLNMIPNIHLNKEYYNISQNAKGGYNHIHLSDAEKAALYKKWRDASHQRLAEMTVEEKKQLADKKRNTWQKHTEVRERHSANTRARRNLEETTKSSEEKMQFQQRMKDIYWSRDEDIIKNQHKAQSDGVKKWHESQTPEQKAERQAKINATKKQRQLKQIYHPNTLKCRHVPAAEIDTWLGQGWLRGSGRAKKHQSGA